MRFLKTHRFNEITAYQLGWSLFGPPFITVYCYAFGDVMVDTAQSHMQKEALAIASKHKIKRIYLTHYHEDHSGNADVLKRRLKTQIYGHPITMEKLSAPFRILPYQKYISGKATPSNLNMVPAKIDTVLGKMIPVPTPGHSEDHTSYLIKSAGVLFSGDLYLGDKIKYFRSDEDMGTQIESLKKILSLDFQTLLCSHCPKRKDGKAHIKRKLDFLQNLYGNIILLWNKGMSERQIFYTLNLKEDYFVKCASFGDVSMVNGIRSAIRYYKAKSKNNY